MIIEFSIENFLSFKDRRTFSMMASADKENESNVYEYEDFRILKSSAIYGANASGKTNLFKALGLFVNMVKNSNNFMPGNLLNFIPFKFDEESIKKPSKIDIVLLINNIKYVYGVAGDYSKIYEEYLYYYPNGRPVKIFERKNVNEYDITVEERKLNELTSKNLENKFFLSTATAWNYEKTKPVYDWFSNGIYIINDYKDFEGKSYARYGNDKELELKKFSLDLLNKADINITEFDINVDKITSDQLNQIPEQFRNLFPKDMPRYTVSTYHNSDKNKLNFYEESLGTQKLFILAPYFKEILDDGKTLIIDEFDRSLHPFLVKHIVEMFNSEKLNKNGAQLIFNTHDTNLLNLDIYRRDQIWFAEKNMNGETDIYPLDDFPIRKTENIEKGYIHGRYGAIPYMNSGNILWKED